MSDEETPLGRQILPVVDLPENFEGEPEDGMQYLFTVRRNARSLPHITRAPNPYEIPERPRPSSDVLPAVNPELPSTEWREVFETRFRNFRKNIHQPTLDVQLPRRRDVKSMPELKDRDAWWAFLSGRPPEDWQMPRKKTMQRGMRAFADETVDPETHLPALGDQEISGVTRNPPPTPLLEPREPTPALLHSIDERMALHLIMYFTHWTNLHLQPEKNIRVTQTHARWVFALLSIVDDYVSADDMHLLRNLARAQISLLQHLAQAKTPPVSPNDINAPSCWMIICAVVGVWGQRDLWLDAEGTLSSTQNSK
ncbi:unnamed protein product [Mycena citricolor]|uniref:Gem-associated protein 2 n=1 Tax=Mycena citricolor TaxID=2018698 RepID=A0AAD2HIK3_9AGAR|nr:unnamed protein product [Mycena citricolor]